MNQLGFKIAIVCAGLVLLCGCSRQDPDSLAQHGSAAVRLKPVTKPIPEPKVRQTVYVPVYSSIYWGNNTKPVELAATVSVRNVSSRFPLILESVRYFDSAGSEIRQYVKAPSELGPLATVEFVILQNDATGGPGANFLVEWAGSSHMNEPLIEAVMVGQAGTVGVSFTSPGRTLKNEAEK